MPCGIIRPASVRTDTVGQADFFDAQKIVMNGYHKVSMSPPGGRLVPFLFAVSPPEREEPESIEMRVQI